MPFKNNIQGFIKIARFPYGQPPSVDVDKHHDGSPSKMFIICVNNGLTVY